MDLYLELDRLRQGTFNSSLKKAKEEGDRVAGFHCAYVPEELLHAMDFVPCRLSAQNSQGTEQGAAYFSTTNCGFVRHAFDKVLRGDYDFLDCMVYMNGCDNNRRLYDNWVHAEKGPTKKYFLPVPNTKGPTALLAYQQELKLMLDWFEREFQARCPEDALRKSIALYNQKRTLLQRIYALRMDRDIKGSEHHRLLLAVSVVRVEKAIELLQLFLSETRIRPPRSEKSGVRLMLVSHCSEDLALYENIESLGAQIVVEKNCLGAAQGDALVEESPTPLAAIAKRYLSHLACSRMMDDFRARLDYVMGAMKAYQAKALVIDCLKFCTLGQTEAFLLQKEAAKANIPTLRLERELFSSDMGQTRTRLQAFLEEIRARG